MYKQQKQHFEQQFKKRYAKALKKQEQARDAYFNDVMNYDKMTAYAYATAILAELQATAEELHLQTA